MSSRSVNRPGLGLGFSAATGRPHRQRVAGSLRAADVGRNGGDGAGAARGGAGGEEGETRRGPRRHGPGVQRAGATRCCCGQPAKSCSTPPTSVSSARGGTAPSPKFTMTACPSPNAYTRALLRKMRCSPTANVDQLNPFFARAGRGAAGLRAGSRRGPGAMRRGRSSSARRDSDS